MNDPAFHDQAHFTDCRDVLCRISLHRYEIGEQTRLNRAESIRKMKHLRINRSGGLERLHRRHAIVDQQFEFARFVAMSEDADVAAIGNRDARIKSSLETQSLGLDRCRLQVGAGSPAAIALDGVSSGERRAQRHAALGHQLEDLGRAFVPMLNRFHSSISCASQSLGRGGVCDHRTPR